MDGFLLHPFHIFNSFLELYDTVFHKPEPGDKKKTRKQLPSTVTVYHIVEQDVKGLKNVYMSKMSLLTW